jgi:hypothetical protein
MLLYRSTARSGDPQQHRERTARFDLAATAGSKWRDARAVNYQNLCTLCSIVSQCRVRVRRGYAKARELASLARRLCPRYIIFPSAIYCQKLLSVIKPQQHSPPFSPRSYNNRNHGLLRSRQRRRSHPPEQLGQDPQLHCWVSCCYPAMGLLVRVFPPPPLSTPFMMIKYGPC